jgi:hypothetical protein
VLGERLGRTGADVIRWLVTGSLLVAIGISTFAIVGRAQRRTT